MWPEKAGAADAVALGWERGHISSLITTGRLLEGISKSVAVQSEVVVEKATVANKLPYGFTLNDKGLYWKDLQSDESAPLRVSARIEVLAQSRSANGMGSDWGKLVQFCDADGEEKQWNIPMRLFATENGSEIMRGLLDRGFDVSARRNSKAKLLEYLHGTQVQERAALVYKTGWYRDAFVMPEQTIGGDDLKGERVHFHTEGGSMCKTATSGTLDEWRDNVGKYCVGNPLLMFAVSVAFSAPLVELLGMNTTVFHFYGSSGWGKSTGMNVACSIMGSHREYQKTWKLTGYFLEHIAAAHSGLLLALDELGECDSSIVGDCVYMLGNGHGKGRGAKNGGVGKDQQWRMACLSNGENTLDATLAMAGKTKTAGMDVRFVEILASLHEDAKDQERYGSVNNIYDFEQPSDFADYLKGAATKYHGTAFPAFIEKLCEVIKGKGRVDLTEWLRKGMAEFKRKHLSQSASGQSIRVADAVALVAMVGELASKWGVTGWPKGEAYSSAEKCFKSWLARRGGEGSLEDMKVLEHVRTQLTTYIESRFKRWDAKSETDSAVIDSHQPITGEIWGYRREEKEAHSVGGESTAAIFYILPDSFKKNFCNGMEANKVARLLRENNALILTDGDMKESRLKTKVRLPRHGANATYVYKIRFSALFGGQDMKDSCDF